MFANKLNERYNSMVKKLKIIIMIQRHSLKCATRGVTALIRAVSGEKQIYSGNLEILPGIGKPGKFFGKYKIFSEH